MKKFKISEIAKIFNISRQTLIYYDNIGLFKPRKIDEDTSYRFYTEEQFFTLHFILTLKKAGLSLKEIKEYTNTPTALEGLNYLRDREKEIDERLEALKESKVMIQQKIKATEKALRGRDTPVILEQTFKRAYLMPVDTEFLSKNTSREELEKILMYKESERLYDELASIKKELGIRGDYFIQYFDKDNISFTGVQKIGFLIPDEIGKVDDEVYIEKATYATITHRAPWKEIDETYNKIWKFIEESNYKIIGDCLEICTNINIHLGSGGEGGRLDIYIPVKKIISD